MPLEKNKKQHQKWILIGFALVLGLFALFLLGTVNRVVAAPSLQNNTRGNQCTDCHTKPDKKMDLESGETLYLTIDTEIFAASAHGEAELAC